MRYDIIIGRPDIIKYNQLDKLKSHFTSNKCNNRDNYIKEKMPGFPQHQDNVHDDVNNIIDDKKMSMHATMQINDKANKRKQKKARKKAKYMLHCLRDSPVRSDEALCASFS